MSKIIKIGAVGLNGRGFVQLCTLLNVPDVEIPSVCDIHLDLAERAANKVEEVTGKRPEIYTDYKKMLSDGGMDALMCCTTWITHVPIAVAAMKAGIDVGIEVGGTSSIEECWELVRTAEETGRHCMLLENCCYGKNELAIFRMEREGIFGEVVHCTGGYRHDLRDEIVYGRECRHGRLNNFIHRNGELYPTHQLGPIAKLLRINRGNRFVSLCSVSSKACGLTEHLKHIEGLDYLKGQVFNQGDIVDTIITCANGETIHLVHDCSLPRPYSRDYSVSGTKGFVTEAPMGFVIHIEGRSPRNAPGEWDPKKEWESLEDYFAEFEHPLWTEYQKIGVQGGHDGMDWLVLDAFADSARNKYAPPIDVYDTAAWMCITALSEQSIAMGGAPVPFPDFTKGKWIDRDPYPRGKYCLEEVCYEAFADESIKCNKGKE